MGMNSVQKLNRLSPGMSSEEVQAIHENWKGFVPYYVVFNKDTRTLESWYADEEEYQRSQARMAETLKPLLEGPAGGGAAAPAGPNDPDLQRWITGNYYSFSSSAVVSAASERSFVLCADGRFRITGEFSASSADWGAASQGGGTGRWTISGDRGSGTITLTYGNGTTKSVRYQVDSQAEQTMFFDQVKFAYAGVANCG